MNDNHTLISDLSIDYANTMCQGDNERTFTRCDISAAYVIGAVETLARIKDVIKESCMIGALTPTQHDTLRMVIETLEARHKDD